MAQPMPVPDHHRYDEASKFMEDLGEVLGIFIEYKLRWDLLLEILPFDDAELLEDYYYDLGKHNNQDDPLFSSHRRVLEKACDYLYDIQVNWNLLAKRSRCGSVANAHALYPFLIDLESKNTL
ncbi:hypothetical protein PG993_004536 [Apiospora rasikravindrae]|uniref:Uncharacterized protein n=1 Tax=Apiospora rasikravindrae TaxID=990691 RepID=A0ABR1TDL6_9PEZI